MSASEAEILLEKHLEEVAQGFNVRAEWQFAPPRKWRFDFCCPPLRIACELEGAIWTQGRHTRGAGYQGDLDKYNAAAALGWTVFRFSTKDVLKGRDLECLRMWLAERQQRAGEKVAEDGTFEGIVVLDGIA